MVDYPRSTSDALAKMTRAGLEIERVPLGSMELGEMRCDCHKGATRGLPLFAKEKKL